MRSHVAGTDEAEGEHHEPAYGTAAAGEHERGAVGGQAEAEADEGFLADARAPVDEAGEEEHGDRVAAGGEAGDGVVGGLDEEDEPPEAHPGEHHEPAEAAGARHGVDQPGEFLDELGVGAAGDEAEDADVAVVELAGDQLAGVVVAAGVGAAAVGVEADVVAGDGAGELHGEPGPHPRAAAVRGRR